MLELSLFCLKWVTKLHQLCLSYKYSNSQAWFKCWFLFKVCLRLLSLHLQSWPLYQTFQLPGTFPLRCPTNILNLSCQKHSSLCFLSKIAYLGYSLFSNDVAISQLISTKPWLLFFPLALHIQSGTEFINSSSFRPHNHSLSISSAPSVQDFLPL